MQVEMNQQKEENKLGLSCAKLSLASAKLHTSLSSDQLKLKTTIMGWVGGGWVVQN